MQHCLMQGYLMQHFCLMQGCLMQHCCLMRTSFAHLTLRRHNHTPCMPPSPSLCVISLILHIPELTHKHVHTQRHPHLLCHACSQKTHKNVHTLQSPHRRSTMSAHKKHRTQINLLRCAHLQPTLLTPIRVYTFMSN